MDSPKKVVIAFDGRRLLETGHRRPLRIKRPEHMLDGAVLARRVQALENDQNTESIAKAFIAFDY